MKNQEILKFIQEYSYLGILIWFAFIQLIFPIPQEVALVSIGYISTHININILLSIFVSAIGIIISDILLFFLSRSGSKITKMLLSKFNDSWRNEMEKRINQRNNFAFAILLVLPEARMLAPLLGGVMGMSFKRFIIIDFLTNLLLSSIYILTGKFFYASFQHLAGKYHKYGHYIFIAIMLIAAILLFFFIGKKYLRNR